jgi:type II secretory pathway component PulF
MTTYSFDISSVLHDVQNSRRNENVVNALKLIGIVCGALAVAGIVMLLAAPHRAEETVNVLAFLILLLIGGVFQIALVFVFTFWPFLLYFWACVSEVRHRTILSLIQTAIETGKPLQDIIRAHASGCFSGYAARLYRFASTLDSGCSLEAAVRVHKGLFRYDVAGMIRLGGDTPETLRSLETVAEDERHFAAIRTNSIIRIVYLCSIAASILPILSFIMIKIIPQFVAIFSDFETDLPAMTIAIIAVSGWFVNYWYLLFPFVVLVSLAAFTYLILQTNVVVFRPIGFRRIFRSTDAAKFLLVFAVGIRHRFPIPAILEMYRWTVPSEYLRGKGAKIQKTVEQGRDWIDAVRQAGFVNVPEASLLQSAERTGNTAAVLDQLAMSKERSQMRKDDLYSKLAFIPLIFLLGAVIGTIVIALFLPVVELIKALS